jgi:hypothetical protein
MSEIPEVEIPNIQPVIVKPINVLHKAPISHLQIPKPSFWLPGCIKTHRDARPSNTQIIEDDPNGTYWACSGGKAPYVKPIEYNRNKIVYSSNKKEETKNETPEAVKADQPSIPKQEEKEDEVTIIECPGPDELRKGDFRNDKKLERVSGHRLSDDGTICITLYEPTNFIDQYIPSPPALANAAAIALVAASAPLLLNAVKPIVKNLIKKLTTKKADKEKRLSTFERRKKQRALRKGK